MTSQPRPDQPDMMDRPDRMERYDLVIGGGGYIGLSLALALKQADPTMRLAVIDIREKEKIRQDGRASAIAAAAIRMLDQLNVWHTIEPEAQIIEDMIITDSQTSDPVRPVFLTFSGKVNDNEPFAYMVPNNVMVSALLDAVEETDITIIDGNAVDTFKTGTNHTIVTLADGTKVSTSLLVAADGKQSRIRKLSGIKTVGWDYDQSGIVTTIEHERPHNGRAEEHFLPAGPFAILPLKGNRSSLVWSEKRAKAERMVKGDNFTFQLELERRFGHHLGTIKPVGPRHAYPLGLQIARKFAAPRLALIGDAAHGIHPISGQGMNMGFRDVAALAEIVLETRRLGLDIGAMTALEQYERWRRFDTVQMGVVTDVLNRLFSNNNPVLRAARDIGLGMVDRMPRIKDYFIREAAGFGGKEPRLLKGEAL